MSKNRKYKSSWRYTEERCKEIFGKDRVTVGPDIFHISFDLSVPLQRHEHDGLLEAFTKHRIKYDINVIGQAKKWENGDFLIPTQSKFQFVIDKNESDRDVFNECLLPFASYSQRNDNPGARRYNNDSVINKLNDLTEVPWVGVVPSPYATDEIYTPVRQPTNLSEDQRTEQELLLAEAFIPERRHPKVAGYNWVERQRDVEERFSLSPVTAIHKDLAPSDKESLEHQLDVSRDHALQERIKKAFRHGKNNSRE